MSSWVIVSFQDSKLSPWVQSGLDHYFKKMMHWNKITHHAVTPTGGRDEQVAKAQDWKKFQANKAFQNHRIILCDARAPERTSLSFAKVVQKWQDLQEDCCFVIGPTYGLDRAWVEAAHDQIKLSSLIFTHELAQLVLAEQLYRALTICARIPYHHEG